MSGSGEGRGCSAKMLRAAGKAADEAVAVFLLGRRGEAFAAVDTVGVGGGHRKLDIIILSSNILRFVCEFTRVDGELSEGGFPW